jgi:hypothetical protein
MDCPPPMDYYSSDKSVISAEVVYVEKHREHPHPPERLVWLSTEPSLPWLPWFDPSALSHSRARQQRAAFAF